jgi:protein-L-isoaspartate(D-aspartate) O-methyltransferase
MRQATLTALALLGIAFVHESTAQEDRAAERARMLAEIAAMALATGAETGRPRLGDAVMAAIGRVPRHRFVSPVQTSAAYENRALSIGDGQTISQPYVVALMTDLLDPKPGDSVLEIGTGSGYQAAVLAELVAKVHTVEILAPLGLRAAKLLRELGYRNIETRIGDGYQGWPDAAPFDAIIVTAAIAEPPGPLLEQLKPGGRMVIPLGAASATQQLMIIEKRSDGTLVTRRTLPVRFVPFTRERTPQ